MTNVTNVSSLVFLSLIQINKLSVVIKMLAEKRIIGFFVFVLKWINRIWLWISSAKVKRACETAAFFTHHILTASAPPLNRILIFVAFKIRLQMRRRMLAGAVAILIILLTKRRNYYSIFILLASIVRYNYY